MVSIPYGKDKAGMMYAFLQTISYQFPMGKVKNNILCCAYSVHHKYSFVN